MFTCNYYKSEKKTSCLLNNFFRYVYTSSAFFICWWTLFVKLWKWNEGQKNDSVEGAANCLKMNLCRKTLIKQDRFTTNERKLCNSSLAFDLKNGLLQVSAVHNHSVNCLLWQSRPESRQNESWFVLWALLKNRLLCEETWWNRRSKARRFFRVVHPFSFLSLLFEQRYTRVLLRNVLVTQFIYPNLWFFLVFVVVHNFFYPHFPIRFRHPQVSSPRFADTSFASRFFELFSLPASLRLNTQRRSAPSMCAFKEEERSVLISVTLMKGITGYKTVPTIGITFCM